MSWFIDVYSAAGVKIGSGPIASASRWESTSRMDQAGAFSFELPAADDKAALLEALGIVRCYALVGGSYQEIGSGIIEQITTSVGDDGAVTLVVSGPDLLSELNGRHMGRYYLDGSDTLATEPMTPVSHADALAMIENIVYTTGWRFTPDPAPPVDSLVGRWNFESALQALISLAAKCRTHFYVSGFRQATFASTASASGVRAVRALTAPGAGVCAIAQLQRVEDAADLVTQITPFGGGNADARLTIEAKTTATPTGYATPSNIFARPVGNTAAIDAYGLRQRVLVWNDITPISSTDGDVQAAANALFEQALRYLQQHMAPAEFYRLALSECSVVLRPMQTIRVVYRDAGQNIDIDADLLILEATTAATADGPQTTRLTVATVDRYPESDTGAVVGRLAQGQMYQAAPQLNANSYVISYTKPVDDAETVTFRFRFDSEVTQLTRVTFDFQILPLESTVKSVAASAATTAAGGATTSSSGGGTTASSTSGGSSTPTSSSGGNTTATSTSGGSSTPTTSSGGSTTVTSTSGSGHTHQIDLANSTTGTAVYFAGTGSPATGDLRTSGGGRINTSSTGSGHTHDVTIGNHTHTVTISGHTHNVTIDAHTHTVSISGHTHDVTIGNHSHTIGDHTHSYTPALSTVYGIFRDTAGNTFGLTDLEYSVDGSTWYAFAVGVNGYASLGDGWHRVDLTALLQNSTTLRPLSSNNALRMRRKSTGAVKKAMIEAQLNVRTIIQAIAAL